MMATMLVKRTTKMILLYLVNSQSVRELRVATCLYQYLTSKVDGVYQHEKEKDI